MTEEAAFEEEQSGLCAGADRRAYVGSIGIFVNGISAMGVSSQSMAAFRLLVGALILAPVLMFMGCRPGEGSTVVQGPLTLFKASPKELVSCALVGIVGLAAANTCYYECMREVGMSTASVLLYTSPVFGVALGRVLYREDVTLNKLVAIVFNIVGCVLAVTNGDLSGFHFSVWGVTSGVIAGLCGASLAVFSRVATKTVHPLAVTFWGFVFGGAVMAAIAAPWPDVAAAMSPQLLLLFLGFGLIPTAVAYILYMQGLSMGLETSKGSRRNVIRDSRHRTAGHWCLRRARRRDQSSGHRFGARVHRDYEHRLFQAAQQCVCRSCR